MNFRFLALSGWTMASNSFTSHLTINNYNPVDTLSHRRDFQVGQSDPQSQMV